MNLSSPLMSRGLSRGAGYIKLQNYRSNIRPGDRNFATLWGTLAASQLDPLKWLYLSCYQKKKKKKETCMNTYPLVCLALDDCESEINNYTNQQLIPNPLHSSRTDSPSILFVLGSDVVPYLQGMLGHSAEPSSLWTHGRLPTRLLCPWDFPGKNTGRGCHFLLQGIFLSQRLNLSPAPPALAGGFFTTGLLDIH